MEQQYIVVITQPSAKHAVGPFASFQAAGDYVMEFCKWNPTANADGSTLTCEVLSLETPYKFFID